MPDDIIRGTCELDKVTQVECAPAPPRMVAPAENIEAALDVLERAQRPLILLGKGMAWSRGEDEVRAFIERTQVPFVRSPMGKGVMPDDHPLSPGAARTLALQQADVIFLMGARLNWILHFGLPPRFDPQVRIIQMDINPEEIGTNVPTEVALVGDAKAITAQLNAHVKAQPWSYPSESTWWTGLRKKIDENGAQVEEYMADNSTPMNYYRVYKDIRDFIPNDAYIQNEGASTMDIGRTLMPNFLPRHRLDAGTFGTMGVGLGQAIAAAIVNPDKKVFCIEGDSAFGFSGMEVETAARYGLNNLTFIIINNNGVGGGPDELTGDALKNPPGAYTPKAHYEKMAEIYGGKGFFVTEPDQLRPALEEAINADKPAIVNIMINARAQRKPQQFAWLTR
jgi:2-hydroxyacyl-CoA lyase 1